MMKQEIIISDNAGELSRKFTELLLNLFNEYPFVNLALSGGNTPKAVFDYWATNCKDSMPWERISFFWGDERCVPPDDPMSNFGMTKEYLFDRVEKIQPDSIYRIHGENESAEESKWYASVLQDKLSIRNDAPSFELIMLGLGDDGHTVSIFPDRMDDLWNSNLDCIVAKHPETEKKRISITGRVVNNAQNIAFLVTGRNKAERVRDIIRDREKYENVYPAAKVNPLHGDIYWFLDKEAASLL